MKCWEEKPEHHPTFTQQIEDVSTLLEFQAGYLGCLAVGNAAVKEIGPMPTSMSSDDIAMASNGTSEPISDMPSGEERDTVIDPLCN